jgi:hypothetical protein
MALSFVSMIPMCVVYTLIFLTLWYWLMKFTFIRRSSVKVNLSGKLSKKSFDTLEYMIPLFALGNIIFYSYTFEGTKLTTSMIIELILGLIYWILPSDYINKLIFKDRSREI